MKDKASFGSVIEVNKPLTASENIHNMDLVFLQC